MMTEGTSQEEAREKIWMVDIDGLLAKGRPEGKLGGHKWYYAKEHEVMKDFSEIVREVQPSILIGASAAGGAFKPNILEMMAEFNERPIIFALSNPTHKAECTAQQAYTSTKGKCIFASGSPFGTVEYEGQVFEPGQGNNVSCCITLIHTGLKSKRPLKSNPLKVQLHLLSILDQCDNLRI